jgi:hypothetical protein
VGSGTTLIQQVSGWSQPTGQVDLTVSSTLSLTHAVAATLSTSTRGFITAWMLTSTTIRILTWNSAGTATDLPFTVAVVGGT